MSPTQAAQEVLKRPSGRYDSMIVHAFAETFGGMPLPPKLELIDHRRSRSFSHIVHDLRFQIRCQFFVGCFRSLGFRRRMIGSPNTIFSGANLWNVLLRGHAS